MFSIDSQNKLKNKWSNRKTVYAQLRVLLFIDLCIGYKKEKYVRVYEIIQTTDSKSYLCKALIFQKS